MKYYIFTTDNFDLILQSDNLDLVIKLCDFTNQFFGDFVVDYVGLDKINFEEFKNLRLYF